MKDQTVLGIVAIIAIAVLDGFALSQGINGAYLLLALSAIGGIAGYGVKGAQNRIKERKG